MSLHANSLKSNKLQKQAVAKEVKHILGLLDDELKSAHEQGKHKVSIPLPISFSIPYMSNKEAQRKIYVRVLRSLLKREFNPKIELSKTQTIFHITWLSDEEQEEIQEETVLLQRHLTKDIKKIKL